MENFGFLDLVISLGVSQGVFLALALTFNHRRNVSANTILTLLLLMACVMLIARILVFKITSISFFQFLSFADALIFLFGPLGYVYVQRLLVSNKKKFQLSWVHYLPVMLYLPFSLYIVLLPKDIFSEWYRAGVFSIPYLIIELIGLMLNTLYMYNSFKIIRHYSIQEQKQLSFNQKVVPFLRFVLWGVFLMLLFWGIGIVNNYITPLSIPLWVGYTSVWIVMPVIIYIIGFYALYQPELFRIDPKISNRQAKEAVKNRLNEHEIEQLKLRLNELIEKDRVYLDADLTLQTLSAKLETSTNDISWLLNNVYKRTFYDFINQFRVAALLQKIHDREHVQKTLLTLSLEVGFNSKSTFNKAFKSIVKDTPSNYIKKLTV